MFLNWKNDAEDSCRTSSRHRLCGMNNDVIVVYFRVKQSLQRCIPWKWWKCYCHKKKKRVLWKKKSFMKAFIQWRFMQFRYCRSKKLALKLALTNENANKYVCIFLEMHFHYFHWEQKWCGKGNNQGKNTGLLHLMELEVDNSVRKYVSR